MPGEEATGRESRSRLEECNRHVCSSNVSRRCRPKRVEDGQAKWCQSGERKPWRIALPIVGAQKNVRRTIPARMQIVPRGPQMGNEVKRYADLKQ